MNDLGGICKKTDTDTLTLTLESAGDKSEMMKKLAESYDIDEIKVFEPSLNDIFIEYAENEI